MATNELKAQAEQIKSKITTNPVWAERAVLALYARQDTDEQQAQQTKWHNSRGFNANDAELLSSFAVQLQAGRHLSEKQLAWAYRKLKKYAMQLARIAAEKAAEKEAA
jgi:hypothetical protein